MKATLVYCTYFWASQYVGLMLLMAEMLAFTGAHGTLAYVFAVVIGFCYAANCCTVWAYYFDLLDEKEGNDLAREV